jgi:hypothetical protein
VSESWLKFDIVKTGREIGTPFISNPSNEIGLAILDVSGQMAFGYRPALKVWWGNGAEWRPNLRSGMVWTDLLAIRLSLLVHRVRIAVAIAEHSRSGLVLNLKVLIAQPGRGGVTGTNGGVQPRRFEPLISKLKNRLTRFKLS